MNWGMCRVTLVAGCPSKILQLLEILVVVDIVFKCQIEAAIRLLPFQAQAVKVHLALAKLFSLYQVFIKRRVIAGRGHIGDITQHIF